MFTVKKLGQWPILKSILFVVDFLIYCLGNRIKRLYLCSWQVLHNQLLLNPPGRERSKGKWS